MTLTQASLLHTECEFEVQEELCMQSNPLPASWQALKSALHLPTWAGPQSVAE